MKRDLILLSAVLKSGKTTTFNIIRNELVESHGLSLEDIGEFQFAGRIKRSVSKILGVPLDILDKQDFKAQDFDSPLVFNDKNLDLILSEFEVKDPEAIKRVKEKYIGESTPRPRRLMQEIGTGIIRDLVDKDLHVKFLLRDIENSSKKVKIITDCLHDNEFEAVTEKFPRALTLGVIRESAIMESLERIQDKTAHSSELYTLGLIESSEVKIHNNWGIKELESQVKVIVKKHLI